MTSRFKSILAVAIIVVIAAFISVYYFADSRQVAPAAAAEQTTTQNNDTVKYVFLFIGDGMSIPQRMMAEEFSTKTGNGKLLINSFQHQALTTTSSANSLITDSAASGTAIACGEKTLNGALGVAADGKRPLESVAKAAKDAGRKVGIMTTVTLNHATPAAFYAHTSSRGNLYKIGLDLIDSNFDYFGGNVISSHNKKSDPAYKGDIYQLAKEKGYTVAHGRKEISALSPDSGKVIAVSQVNYAIDYTQESMKLEEFVRQAINMLDNEKGFFIMAEGGMIDYAGHANDAGTNIKEVIDFDNAVKVAYEFALKHPDDTLIVVTGDHETGGLTLGFAGTGYKSYIENMQFQKSSLGQFAAEVKNLAAMKKVIVFDDIKSLITDKFGLLFAGMQKSSAGQFELTPTEEANIRKAFERQLKSDPTFQSSTLANEVVRCFNNKCSIAWGTTGHSSMPVLTTAFGKKSDMFNEFIDNTDIAKRLKQVVR